MPLRHSDGGFGAGHGSEFVVRLPSCCPLPAVSNEHIWDVWQNRCDDSQAVTTCCRGAFQASRRRAVCGIRGLARTRVSASGFTAWMPFNSANAAVLVAGAPKSAGVYVIRCRIPFARSAGTSDVLNIWHLTQKMLEHYSHIRMTAKRQALDGLDAFRAQEVLRSLEHRQTASVQ